MPPPSVGEHIWRGLQSRSLSPDLLEENIQAIGNESSSVALNHFQMSLRISLSFWPRTNNSCSLSQESGGTHSPSLYQIARDISPSVFSTPGSSSGETYCGAPQYSMRHSIQIPCSSKHGVGTTSSSFQSCDSSLGSPRMNLLFCDQSQSQTLTFVSPVPDPKSFCGRRNEPILERNVGVRLPSFQVFSQYFRK
ncbi:unnamed protein product [Mytilus edulis]|uniref:Uncharacterized protein n=1 Tax=Mytilus edulis TaxID=6550 RepID=A0A8S3TAJ1_MYTED|nr:unnamed protein product [Mytilus edulis]